MGTEDGGVLRTNAMTNRTNLKAHEASLAEHSMNLNLVGGEESIRDDRMLTPNVHTVFSQPTETQMAHISGHQPKSSNKSRHRESDYVTNPIEANLEGLNEAENRTFDH